MSETANAERRPTTELEWLGRDLPEYNRLLNESASAFSVLTDLRNMGRQRRLLVISDYFIRIFSLVSGLYVLLREEIRTPAVIITRAIFEAGGSMGYLVNHAHSEFEAAVLLTFSSLKKIRNFPDQAALVAEHERNIATMPGDVVAEARRRMKTPPRSWSGKSFKEMADNRGIDGYRTIYGILSEEVHGSAAGDHVRLLSTDTPGYLNVVTGRELSPEESETLANFGRRMLHHAFHITWQEFDAGPVQINSEDPQLWLAANKTKRGRATNSVAPSQASIPEAEPD